jgi:ribonuclease P protein component
VQRDANVFARNRDQPVEVDFRLPRSARVRSSSEFDAVFKASARVSVGALTAFVKSTSHGTARLGLAISRRAARSAVVRNRIKRLVRESFRHRRHALGGADVVVSARGGADKLSKADLWVALEKLWIKAERLCARPS